MDDLPRDLLEYENAINETADAIQRVTRPLPGPENPHIAKRVEDVRNLMKRGRVDDKHG